MSVILLAESRMMGLVLCVFEMLGGGVEAQIVPGLGIV